MCRILLLTLLLFPGMALAGTPTAAQILSQSKAASGGSGWDHIYSMRVTATATMSSGPSGAYSMVIDFRTGHVVSHFKVGSMVLIARGFNGGTGWKAMFGRAATRASSPEAQKANVTHAYMATNGWWYPQRAPAKVRLVGKRVDGSASYWVLNITPEGGIPFDLWINTKTQLVSREVLNADSLSSTTFFSDYRMVHGVKVAFHLRSASTVSGRETVSTTQLKKVTMNVPVSAKDFAMP